MFEVSLLSLPRRRIFLVFVVNQNRPNLLYIQPRAERLPDLDIYILSRIFTMSCNTRSLSPTSPFVGPGPTSHVKTAVAGYCLGVHSNDDNVR